VRRSLGPLWLRLLFIGALGFGLERLIVTDTEAIESLVEEAATFAGAGDLEGLGGLLAADFRHGGKDRQASLDEVARRRAQFTPKEVRARVSQLEVTGDTARGRLLIVAEGGRMGFARVMADVSFTKEDGDWRFLGVGDVSFGP